MRITGYLLILLLCCSGCQKQGVTTCDDSQTSLYRMANFRVGVAANVDLLQTNTAYRNIVINQFNVILPESAYLISKVHPSQDVFDFTELDYLAAFCKQYNKHMEGANLIYQLYIPDWLNRYEGDQQAWEALAKNHIQTIVSRYKGVVESWMVVNEALNEDGALSNNIWKQHIGDSYIEKFFTWAHEADPDARLFYNDFDLENNVLKLDAALKLADMLRGKGIKIDGIGMQMHNEVQFPTVDEVNKAMLKIAGRNYKVYFSEWDLSFNLLGNKTMLTEDMKQQQKYLFNTMTKAYRMLPEKNRYGISFWGVGDADSWIRGHFNRIDWPLLYDDNYKAKPAYCGFAEALK
jgi:endo-1,4-beta-xylanase